MRFNFEFKTAVKLQCTPGYIDALDKLSINFYENLATDAPNKVLFMVVKNLVKKWKKEDKLEYELVSLIDTVSFCQVFYRVVTETECEMNAEHGITLLRWIKTLLAQMDIEVNEIAKRNQQVEQEAIRQMGRDAVNS